MKNSIKKLVLAATMVPAVSFGATVEERLAELEANQSLNIFKFSGSLESFFDGIHSTQTSPSGAADQATYAPLDENVEYMRLKFSLNADADVSPNIKLYSRLTTSKFYNVFNSIKANTTTTAPNVNQDLYVSNSERGSQMYLSKAYADITVPDTGLVFSFGRLSTFEGPPLNMRHGRARMGTYPGLLYNAELDGMAVTYNKAAGSHNFAARVVYTPFSYFSDSSGTLGSAGLLRSPRLGAAANGTGGVKTDTNPDLTSAMLEYSNNDLSFGRLTVIAQAWQTGWLYFNGSEVNFGSGAGSGFVGSKFQASALHLDLSDVMETALDLSATVLTSKVENKGSMSIPTGGPAATVYGYGASAAGQALSDSSTLIAAKYRFGNTHLGAEYLMGGKKAFVYDTNNEDLTYFYSTTGNAQQIYVLHKFTSEFGLRVGYRQQEYKKTSFTLGPQSDTDRKIDTAYANLRLDF